MRSLRIAWLLWRHPEYSLLTGKTFARWLLLEGWKDSRKQRIPAVWQ